MANRVFEDRLGVIVASQLYASRLPSFAALGIRDVFLPRTSTLAAFDAVRGAGLYAHMWAATDKLDAFDYANRTLLDIRRLGPGAVELNIELPADPPLRDYIAEVVRLLRSRRPRYRFRLNVAPWKAFALPHARLAADPALYVCEQTYHGNMSRVSEADAYDDLLAWGVPRDSATLCYGAAGPVPGSSGRVCTLPDLTRRNRGVIFSDDLMAEAGVIP